MISKELKALIKCQKVIDSCETRDHILVAKKYISLFKSYFDISCDTIFELKVRLNMVATKIIKSKIIIEEGKLHVYSDHC